MARRTAAAVVVAVGVAAVGAVAAATSLSPRPGAALIRAAFERGGAQRHRALEVGRPDDVGVVTRTYRDDQQLDVYRPDDTTDALPTVVWTHGGGGLSGRRTDDAGWFARLAREGFTVVALDYRLAPAATYPAALRDVTDALAFVTAHADELGADLGRVVLGGDSAGAQMTAQLAVAATSPAYARRIGLPTVLGRDQLRGVVLACGYYDLDVFRGAGESLARPLRWAVRTILWSITGSRDPDPSLLDEMSSARHATEAFPAALVLGGNGDPLTDTQSRPLADHLRRLGVDVTTVFYEPDHLPELPHEYQFDLSLPDACDAFDSVVAFARRVTA
jgi:acetyl esterase/lipase